MYLFSIFNLLFKLQTFYTTDTPGIDISITEEYVKESVKELTKNMYKQFIEEVKQEQPRTVWGFCSNCMFSNINVRQSLKNISFNKKVEKVYVGYVCMNKTRPNLYSSHMVPFMFDHVRLRIMKGEMYEQAGSFRNNFFTHKLVYNSLNYACKTHVSISKNQEQLQNILLFLENAILKETNYKNNEDFAELLIISDEAYTDLDIQAFKKILNGSKHGIFVILPAENYNKEKEEDLLRVIDTSIDPIRFFKCDLNDYTIKGSEGPISLFFDEKKKYYDRRIVRNVVYRTKIEMLIAFYRISQFSTYISVITVHNSLKLRAYHQIQPEINDNYKVLELSYGFYEDVESFSHFLLFSKSTGVLEKITVGKRVGYKDEYKGDYLFDFNVFMKNLSSILLNRKTWGSFYANDIDVFNLGSGDIIFSNKHFQNLLTYKIPDDIVAKEYFLKIKSKLKNNIENFLEIINGDDIESTNFLLTQERPLKLIEQIDRKFVVIEKLNKRLEIADFHVFNYDKKRLLDSLLALDDVFVEGMYISRIQMNTLDDVFNSSDSKVACILRLTDKKSSALIEISIIAYFREKQVNVMIYSSFSPLLYYPFGLRNYFAAFMHRLTVF